MKMQAIESLPFSGVTCKSDEKDCTVWWMATDRNGRIREVRLTIPNYMSFATNARHAELFLEDTLNSSEAHLE